MLSTRATRSPLKLAAGLVVFGAWGTALAAGCELIAGVRTGELAPGIHAGASGGTGGSTTSSGGGPTGGGGSSYAAEVLSDGPIAYWRLGEDTTPTAFDSSGNGHDGTYQSVTVGVPGAIAGDPDTAAHFDGSGAVDFGDHFGFEGNVPFSVELWIKPESHSEGFLGKAHYDVATGYSGWFLVENVGPDYPLDFYRVGAVAGPALPQGTYSYVVGAYDGVNLMLYVDGQMVDQAVDSDPLSVNIGSFVVGAVDGWGQLGGAIDEVALYDKNLAPSRISAHFHVGTGR